PRLGVAAHPVAVGVSETGPAASVRFRSYTNYTSFITRAEIRIFDKGQSLQAAPLGIIPLDDAGLAEWQPATAMLDGSRSTRELVYVLRAYDAKGDYDETEPKQLWLYHEQSPASAGTPAAEATPPRELLAAYGESD